jgi:hypothetical protein
VSTNCISELRSREANNGFSETRLYDEFAGKVKATKRNILTFLIDQNTQGKQVVGYGAPGKGNTLLNYCGIREDLLQYTVDLSPHKQNTYTPGTHIPIYSPDKIKETKPDFVFILPWNLRDEISHQCQYIREWGGRFVVPIPEIQIFWPRLSSDHHFQEGQVAIWRAIAIGPIFFTGGAERRNSHRDAFAGRL